MNLSKQCEVLMSFFLDNSCISHTKPTKTTKNILSKLYDDVSRGYNYINTKKTKDGKKFYKCKSTKITSVHQIPRPKTFNTNSFPSEVREHIDKYSNQDLSYTFSLFSREVKVHFILEESVSTTEAVEVYNDYIDRMLTWLHIVNEYSAKKCSKTITIFIYLTSLTKQLPVTNIQILDEIHVNTAFTYTCPIESEIVIFRKEEWFKVFMHETMHNFALDFSDMNQEDCNKQILDIFQVKSDVNLFEAYTEFWAEIMNAVFCSYYLQKDKSSIAAPTEFYDNFEFFINYERSYGIFQMVKTLNFMELTYKDLYSKSPKSEMMRETMYKEKSNILSYYVLKIVLMNQYQGFLSWSNKNNLSLLQFKKTTGNIDEFCNFIKKNYKTKSLLANVTCMEGFLRNMKNSKNTQNKDTQFILKNMRMSISEMS